ncbi:hypothetical protein JTB14_031879 [Gonioctena quinquepunctata]|nr:hypothetical protein JTB14_031879 [Gonioctena quinquepunctata]
MLELFSFWLTKQRDIAGQDMRYAIESDHTLYVYKEDFLCFVKVESATGQDLANTIITTLQNLGVNLNNMKDRMGHQQRKVLQEEAILRKVYPKAFVVVLIQAVAQFSKHRLRPQVHYSQV